MPTAKAVILHRSNSGGEYLIQLRLHVGNHQSYISLKYRTTEKHWLADKGKVRKSHPLFKEINECIEHAITKADSIVRRMDRDEELVTHETWKNEYLLDREVKDFWTWADKWLEKKEAAQQIFYGRRCASTIRNFKLFTNSPELLPWRNLTVGLIVDWDHWMRTVRQNSPNTRHGCHRVLNSIIREAVQVGEVNRDDNPYDKFKMPKKTPVKKLSLTLEDIKKISNLNLTESPYLDLARDVFVFAVLGRGMRFGDVARLQWDDIVNKRVEYTMGKTSQNMSFPIRSDIQAIISKYVSRKTSSEYIFPLGTKDPHDKISQFRYVSSANARTNKRLKEIALLAEISGNLTFHVARHTFTMIVRRNGSSTWDLKDLLGHSDVATTGKYVRELEFNVLDEQVDSAFGR
ncbi:MAG: tyrosine-type recombinase/integrase [Bacteroidetes bacterium]|nr:tyrosine-type recombinase/integrase [Bacteroidota bacterium]